MQQKAIIKGVTESLALTAISGVVLFICINSDVERVILDWVRLGSNGLQIAVQQGLRPNRLFLADDRED